jgi:hypothetical protein
MPSSPPPINITSPAVAADYAHRSGLVRKRFKTILADLCRQVSELTERFDRLDRRPPAAIQNLQTGVSGLDDSLKSTREQLFGIDCALAAELAAVPPDARRIKDLASAKTTLLEAERRLSGRPLPATFRASSARQKQEPVNRPPPTPL